MLEIASQMILCLLLAALLGFIIGYLFGKSTCANDDCGHTVTPSHDDTHTTASETHESANDDKPALLTAPRNGQKDNLTRIKGVGVKIEQSLNDIGIYHFDQIAAWDAENITWADSTLGFPGRAEREQWVSQAKALAEGKETEFSKRVDAGEVSTSKQA
ncbi:MAG TPA: hypothetical protein ENK90_03435 [Epsilonproteobacteria bacterium]|nr:hypothetical protein [Campylobacterota bacterium]HHE06153.1 hypothetical protein [Campylobacterota bacterium]